MKKPLVVIGGATACGKTDVGVLLAQKINGEIISADSMQVYCNMDIGTAKPTKQEMKGIKHYLIDEIMPNEEYNVMIFQKKAKQYMEQIWNLGKIPILVGGTGFYINAIVYDTLFEQIEQDSTFRNDMYAFAKENGAEALYQKLKEIDPDYAKTLHANNVKRVTRALEYHHFTGQLFSKYNTEQKQKQSPYHTAMIVLTMERQKLYDRIEKRIDTMIEKGLLKEVEQLLKSGYTKDFVSMQAIGYKELIPYFSQQISLEQAIYDLKKNTRHFAKRQLTWFKRQTNGYWIDITDQNLEKATEEIIQYLKQTNVIGE
ncbi:tRNA (adenosine(37)-N6)-dimethylallyltransferase MiaA [Clostridium sp. MD294]|uniref:tRNA (adenosine(37)-N6)-dimethylallyltransferase MiaA n=1 Tax=Clostridium sp. MD294 TaxID=97138 RepID=UPI0002CB6698|nr:tRNA (adenosine(37)-N6)-dimethylallyltransferase MiaA [Clostridium sp. MD294]NDO46038.1 tRNA (adenosine(37)-N6)-dimethylallyltransferase MiaA [Clostridium sp. MD294]USF30298.1 tRNA dimethylallyltransferase [Clostridium sp. MD294]